MSINEIRELQKECLDHLDDYSLARRYSELLEKYLNDEKTTDEIISVIINGIDIDRASALFDYFESAQKSDIQDCWKKIKKNTVFKDNKKNASVKLLVGMIYMTLIKNENVIVICPGVFRSFINLINDDKKPIIASVYGPILVDYCFSELQKQYNKFPEWEDLKIAPQIVNSFIEIAIDIINKNDTLKDYYDLNKWLNKGKKIAADAIERERIEEQIPKSKIDDIKSILEHYTKVEKQFRDGVYREDKLQKDIVELNLQIEELNRQKNDLERQICELNGNMQEQQKSLVEAGKEIEERKAINDAFDALKKNDEGALLKDIANELKAEYRDFKASEADDMDIQLGEIYRVKIENIFKILDKKGIKVE
ncbi:MAG: hypothetical protein MJ131_05310 [Lachnospiraceae bacterium]|nr:hypothetical protein [Lachnospiraceae bacterium]